MVGRIAAHDAGTATFTAILAPERRPEALSIAERF